MKLHIDDLPYKPMYMEQAREQFSRCIYHILDYDFTVDSPDPVKIEHFYNTNVFDFHNGLRLTAHRGAENPDTLAVVASIRVKSMLGKVLCIPCNESFLDEPVLNSLVIKTINSISGWSLPSDYEPVVLLRGELPLWLIRLVEHENCQV